ncbi:MAG: hypothetical protein ACJAZP_003634 [Psychromonas sp.]|jgi:hypothetical protein|uniref:hypothetical protein n=1 Tax=Psychromonas sp. TaxID=1884585 RepID=UPI0039E51732
MKLLFVVLALTTFLAACDNDAGREREETIRHLEDELAIINREPVNRNMLFSATKYATLCDFKYNINWCEGYFTAVYASIENSGSEVCAPRHKRSDRVVFESAWTIVKESLSRLPENSKVNFYDSTVAALTKRDNCDD